MKGQLLVIFAVAITVSYGGSLGNTLRTFTGQAEPTSSPPPLNQTITFNASYPPNGPVETNKINMTAQEIIQAQGYPVETHNATTPDGYKLTYVRLPRPGAVPVYVLHGVLCSCRDFVVQPGNQSLAFQLYDAGYDVWLGNLRGNSYSNGHVEYDSSDPLSPYWNYSINEIIEYDNPTSIDFILNKTCHDKLVWIGYSLGTLSFFGTMASKPDYNNKIYQFMGLAPLIYQGNSTSPLVNPVLQAAVELYEGQLIPSNFLQFLGVALPEACEGGNPVSDVGPGICGAFLSDLLGPNKNETNLSVIPVAFKEFPNEVSVNVVRHLYQDTRVPEFRHYDYGTPQANKAAYNGSSIPPRYNVTNVVAPVFLYSGTADTLTAPKDADRLAQDLPVYPNRKYAIGFNHIDFVYGRHAPVLYGIVINDLDNILGTNKTTNTTCSVPNMQ